MAAFLEGIQKDLFLLGNFYASDMSAGKQFSLTFIAEKNVDKLEQEINSIEATLPPLKEFILPNGNVAASQLHVCRTVCRRLERLIVSFEIEHSENRKNTENGMENASLAQKYINRLSDYLFVAARLADTLKSLF
ncbi:MAG: ATP:cob(I)alamin adenosyltransferase [Bacteroidales bacterium]|nr:ATP:cob(I)alamin adenosyltransferase [Bacteroidales bacterium]